MDNVKHTPGPWEAVDGLTVRGPFEHGNPDKPGFLVATMPAYRSTGDSRLIAAAPELLEVARGILVEEMLQYLPAEYVAKVRAAIAKATGAA